MPLLLLETPPVLVNDQGEPVGAYLKFAGASTGNSKPLSLSATESAVMAMSSMKTLLSPPLRLETPAVLLNVQGEPVGLYLKVPSASTGNSKPESARLVACN